MAHVQSVSARSFICTLASVLLALGLAATALAQDPETPRLTGEVTGEGFTRIRIAVPDPDAPPSAAGVALEIARTVRADLEFSGFFDVVDPSLYELIPESPPDAVPHEDWESINADAVVVSRLSAPDDRIDLRAWLHDNPSQSVLMGRRYGGQTDQVRLIAHQLSDDLVKQYTGRAGVARTRIAFVSRHESGSELYLMDYDGQRVRRLTTTGTINLSPAWSPDANRLAFVSWRENRPDIYFMDRAGTLTRTPVVVGELNSAPDWSPDGNRIVYSSDAEGNSELYVLDLSTGSNTRLTRTAAIETSPAFSPNGREIAFTSDRSGSPQIYVMDAEGLNTRRLSFKGSYNDSAAWSPRGDRMAYASNVDGSFQIALLDLTTGEINLLTRGRYHNENPRWSPDGRHLVFSSNRTGTYDLYTMAADGSDVRRLTRGTNSITPDWSR
jgi:TolB protein